MRAEGARKTGDPVSTMLRARHCVEYVELALAEASSTGQVAADLPTIEDPAAWVAERFDGLMTAWERANTENPRNPHGPMERMLRQRVANPADVRAAFRVARKQAERDRAQVAR
jgi:hypothetical protein